MGQENSQTSIRRELTAKEQQIKQRIDALEEEIVSTPAAIKSAIVKNPLLGIGAAVATAAVVAMLFSGRRKKRSSVTPAHQSLIEGYAAAIAKDVRKGVERGRDPEEVVRKFLRGRAPVIVYAPEVAEADRSHSKSYLRQLGDLALKTALGFAVKKGIDLLTANLDVKQLQKMLMLEEEGRRTGAETAPPHAGDGSPDPSPIRSEPQDH